ncbi:MAG: methyl-accepting chemotaxis protein [Hyphomicrobiaceae bacterium]|nr:methyl-accepting chemotaxis protein [Hyphomicrobiaceae bacterium]
MWNRLRISSKLPVAILGVALATGIGIGAVSYWSAASTVEADTIHTLNVIAEGRAAQLKDYLGSIDEDLTVVASDDHVHEALLQFSAAYKAIPGDASAALKKVYINDNPNPAGQKHKLDAGPSKSGYDAVHAAHHPYFRKLLETRGYYDIFLFDNDGNCVYTVFKEEDFSTNLNPGGPWANTDLGQVYRSAAAATEGKVSFSDFRAYAPSNNVPASFIAMPMFENGKRIGVLAFQMPIDKINAIMAGKTGLGATGETIIVGADSLLRNNSSFSAEDDILKASFKAPVVATALAGNTASDRIDSYRGQPMLAAATPIEFHGVKWAVAAVQTVDEAFAPLAAMRNVMLISLFGFIALAGLTGFFVARSIARPISRVVTEMNTLAKGNTDIHLEDAVRLDEIGDMTRAVAVFRDNAIERERLRREQERDVERQRIRQRTIETLIANFRGDVSVLLGAVDTNMDTMQLTSRALAGVADSTSSRADACAAASEEASSNVQTVATAAEELSSSIHEISRQLARTTDIVGRATEDARQTNRRVVSLADAARRIGDVVELISGIADQTNLLALNATIEAARAGEAGRGFAVVAQEVKALANQTGRATSEISGQIVAIQSETEAAVGAIQAIAQVMEEVNSYAAAIAAAVEQQGSATQEISRNVIQAAQGTRGVASNVAGVSASVEETTQAASQVATSSSDAASKAMELRNTVDNFLAEVAAA